MKIFIILLSVSLVGCTSTKDNLYQTNGELVDKQKAREAWFKDLAETNPYLHASLLKAMFASKAYKKRIYVYKKIEQGRKLYLVSQENQHGFNVLSVEYDKRIIHFDHYGDADGKPMDYFVDLTFINDKLKKLHNKLKIGEFN